MGDGCARIQPIGVVVRPRVAGQSDFDAAQTDGDSGVTGDGFERGEKRR